MVACLLYLRSSSADPLLFLCTKLEPNSMQIRTGSAILSTLVRVWFEFASSLQRIYSGGKAEDERRYSRLTSDLLLTYGREKSRSSLQIRRKKYPGIFLYMELPGYDSYLSVGLCQFQIFISIWVDAYIPFDFGRRCTHAYIPGVSGSEEIVQ